MSETATASQLTPAEHANGTPVVDDWRATLPEDLRGDKTLERYKSVAELAKSRVEVEKLIGSSVRLPGKDAKPEDIAKAKTETMAKLRAAGLLDSAPESPDKYEIDLPEWTAVEGAWSKDIETKFRERAHKRGWSNADVNDIVQFYTSELVEPQIAAEKAHRDQVQAELQREWGPNYKPNLGIANKAIQKLDDEINAKGELIGVLQASGLADHPLMVKGMAWLGRSMWEHDIITVSSGSGGLGADEAQAKMDAMFNDKNHPYNQRTHPEHRAAIDEFLQLSKIANRRGR